jgi:hypothetical protein
MLESTESIQKHFLSSDTAPNRMIGVVLCLLGVNFPSGLPFRSLENIFQELDEDAILSAEKERINFQCKKTEPIYSEQIFKVVTHTFLEYS